MPKLPTIKGLPNLPGADADVKGAKSWLPVFQSFIEELRVQSKEIPADDERGTKLKLWGSQRIALNSIAKGLDEDVHDFYFLKSRQLGVTTVTLAIDLFWLAVHPRMLGVVVADTDTNSAFFRKTLQNYYKSLPPEFVRGAFEKIKDNSEYMEFSNGSRLDFLVAGSRKKNWGEGRGYTLAHVCMAKGTPVVVEHGRIKNIEDVKVGEKMLTHTGQETTVIDVFGQPGAGKKIIKIQPWLGHAIKYTEWHKIPTQRGLLQAKDVRKTDFLVMPVRPITGENKIVTLPVSRGIRANRRIDQLTGRFVDKDFKGFALSKEVAYVNLEGAGSGRNMTLDEEVGFAIGYYLAEGSMKYNSLGGPCGITFTRHRNETGFADRAVAALRPYTTRHHLRTDRKNCLTSTDEIYGTPLAEWIEWNFGSAQTPGNKFIPDDVFGWGKDFCRGLLSGMLCGDGSKKLVTVNKRYKQNQVVMPTTRSSLAMQIRDIAASLGVGWATINFKEGGNHYGRNCKPCWRITWNGSAAARLRQMMGRTDISKREQDFTAKYVLEADRVLIRIRSIEECPDEPEIWDISVDHSDHTFRTPYMATSNTEVSKFGTEEGISSFKETLAETHPNRLFCWESTANGRNHWEVMYKEAERDVYGKRAIFIGWWAKEINSISAKDQRFKLYAQLPNQAEREKMELVRQRYGIVINAEQLAWRRARDADESKSKADNDQNQCWLPEEAFVTTGMSFFQTRLVSKLMDFICDENNNVVFKGYRFELGQQFTASRMYPITQDDIDTYGLDCVELRVWEEPIDEATYVVGCDPAYGRTDNADRHAISVWRCFADKMVQVAEYADNKSETHQAAWVLAYLCGVYKNCIVNIELTGPGRAVFKEFDDKRMQYRSELYSKEAKERDWEDFLGTARYYLYHRPDALGAGYAYHTELTWSVKGRVLNQFRDSFTTGILMIRSAPLCDEMLGVVQDGSEIAAPGSLKDDRVFAAMYAHMAYKDWVQAGMISRGQTYQAVLESEQPSITPGKSMVRHIVTNFWKTREEQLANPPEEPPSFFEERGL